MRLRLAAIAAGFSPPFSLEQIEKSRRYHGPIYLSFVVGLTLGLATLGLLSLFASWRLGPWWLAAPLFAAIAVALSTLARLPVIVWRSWTHERRWGFSTQTGPGLVTDL